MRLRPKSMAVSGGLLGGGAILFVGLVNLIKPTYGNPFLQRMSSVYPWFHASRTFGDVVIGTVDGLVDRGAAGFLFAWLYNLAGPASVAR